MKKTLSVCFIALVMVGLAASISQAAVGPYLSLQAGGTWLEDADIEYDGVPSSVFSEEAEFDTGYNVGAALGYDYGPARLEAEIAYRQNDFDSFSGQFLGAGFKSSADGDVDATSFMVNAYWDFESGSPVTPYLGAGAGFANVSYNDVRDDLGDFVDDDDNVFAYQLAAGIGFEIDPNLTFDLGYRYFTTDDPEVRDSFGDTFETEYKSHNVSLGLRMTF